MELDDAYANGAYIADADSFPPRWAKKAQAFREAQEARGRAATDIAYGPRKRERFDLFLPEGAARGLIVFIHGGYWRAFDKSSWSHLAAGPLARGWAVALPSYDLCPDVKISQITRQIARAVTVAAENVPGPLVICGHSAGGHLTARMGDPGVLPAEVRQRVERLVPISPLSDLRPLLKTSMNDDFGMSEAEAKAESPVFQPVPEAEVIVCVGGAERPVFLEQARWLAQAWRTRCEVTAGEHHFDVINGLEDHDGALCRAVCGLLG